MKFFGLLREPQKMVPKVPREAIERAFILWVTTFNTLHISGVAIVASLQRLEGFIYEISRIHYGQLQHIGLFCLTLLFD